MARSSFLVLAGVVTVSAPGIARADWPSQSCQSASHWTTVNAYNDPLKKVEHPQIVNDGSKQIVVFVRDDDLALTPGGERVYTIERCGTGGQNLVHVSLVELDISGAGAPLAEAWWVRKTYTDCL